MKHTRQYTWEGVQEGVNSIAMQLFKDEWRPDYIVGITRGGLVPAVLLSHTTDIPMKTLCVQLESDGLDENTERNALMARDALKDNKKILIIDDKSNTFILSNFLKIHNTIFYRQNNCYIFIINVTFVT